MSESELNQAIAEQICDARQWNGRQFQAGECVALLDGKVIAVAASLGDAVRALRRLDPNTRRGMVFEVAPPAVDVIR